MFFPICRIVSRPLRGYPEELLEFSNLSRYRHLSSIPLHRLALLENSKRRPLLLSVSHTFNNPGYADKLRRSFSQHNFQSDTNADSAKKGSNKVKLLMVGFGLGAVIGLGYVYNKNMRQKSVPIANLDSGNSLWFSEPPPIDFIAKKVVGSRDARDLQLTLFQYEPCPFCKKVRAFLDFAGLSYDVVEVNPVTKKQLGWSAYKKVPIIIVKGEEGYQQLNDSSMIISSLASYLEDAQQDLQKIVKYYPQVDFQDGDGKKGSEIMNRYFLMFGDKEPAGRSKESIVEERRWRKWSDDVLMHTLSPNIYRTWEESLEAFNMFSKNGDWEHIFPPWERQMVIYVGAAVMYIIGKRLKKRHNLLDDARQSLYNEVNYFLKTVKAKGTHFIGGDVPNLADLAVYGCISSIDGTRTFDDLMRNTKLSPWYEAMCRIIDSRRGKMSLSKLADQH
ncbi:prostaglandin E synthase 2 [Daphnia magna]|uniref:prostaglandin E synthase 2 n=1 Tax=Daphnia magna TaxID=35525 RepID=UPI001E1BD659|nr:prostaglandin E synthase 2 [Daphnia magna]